MRGIFLDDERLFEDVTWVKYPENVEWRTVRTHYEFIIAIENNDFDIVSFDHDIQSYNDDDVEVTGLHLLKWMLSYYYETGKKLPQIYFHTMNSIGKRNMEAYYNNFVNFYNKEWEK